MSSWTWWQQHVLPLALVLLYAYVVSKVLHFELFVIASGVAVVLCTTGFGFSTSFRQFITKQQGAMLRCQIIVILVTSITSALLFVPNGGYSRHDGPLSLGVILGAFLFGFGMQLGDGCASGSCTNVGNMTLHSAVVLISFIVSSTAAAYQFEFWSSFNATGVNLITRIGTFPAILIQSAVLLLAFIAILIAEKKRYKTVRWSWSSDIQEVEYSRLENPVDDKQTTQHGVPVNFCLAALGLISGILLIYWKRRRPWGITSAFALWGSKTVLSTGLDDDVSAWYYWKHNNDVALSQSICAIISSLKTSKQVTGVSLKKIVGGTIAGSCMGYGARIAHGCNIGAFIGGLNSYSLFGWLWIFSALPGMILGIFARPVFGL